MIIIVQIAISDFKLASICKWSWCKYTVPLIIKKNNLNLLIIILLLFSVPFAQVPKYSRIFTLLRWRHDFLPRFLFIETTETEKNKKKRHVYLLMITLRLFYASVNLTIFNFFHLLHWLITNITFRSNCQQIWHIYSYLWSIQIC
jgi:hypothetical protein